MINEQPQNNPNSRKARKRKKKLKAQPSNSEIIAFMNEVQPTNSNSPLARNSVNSFQGLMYSAQINNKNNTF